MLLAYAFRKHDLASIFYFVLLWMGIQLIIWLVGRYSLENDWWRSALLALLGTALPGFAFAFGQAGGIPAVIGAAIVVFLLVWIIGGMLYEPELQQKIVITAAVGILAIALVAPAFFLRNHLLDSFAP